MPALARGLTLHAVLCLASSPTAVCQLTIIVLQLLVVAMRTNVSSQGRKAPMRVMHIDVAATGFISLYHIYVFCVFYGSPCLALQINVCWDVDMRVHGDSSNTCFRRTTVRNMMRRLAVTFCDNLMRDLLSWRFHFLSLMRLPREAPTRLSREERRVSLHETLTHVREAYTSEYEWGSYESHESLVRVSWVRLSCHGSIMRVSRDLIE